MSLDISLIVETPIVKKGTGVFVRENGATKELTVEEVKEKFPDAIDVEENEHETNCVYDTNITHNLGDMAEKAGIYEALWRPYRLVKGYGDIKEGDREAEYEFEASTEIRAKDIVEIVEKGLEDLKARPDFFRKFDSENGWGVYKDFVPFVENYLEALKQYPNAIVKTDR